MTQEIQQQLPDMERDEELMAALATVNDPELHIPITEMGLIYGVVRENIKGKESARVTMTLTTIGCPLFDVIKYEVETVLQTVDGIEDVILDLTFDPPWHTGMMSEETQLDLGVF